MSILTIAAAAELLEVSPTRVREIVASSGAGSRRLNLATVVQGRVEALRKEAAQTGQSAMASRLRAARTRSVELRNAAAEGIVLEYEEHLQILTEIMSAWKGAMYSVPARVSRDIGHRRRIEAAIESALTRLSDRLEREADCEDDPSSTDAT